MTPDGPKARKIPVNSEYTKQCVDKECTLVSLDVSFPCKIEKIENPSGTRDENILFLVLENWESEFIQTLSVQMHTTIYL